MNKDFESELKGTLEQATNAKQQIEKYFKRYGESNHEDAKKHQLMFGSKVVSCITKCNEKHLEVYCNIIQTFGDQFVPENGLKYWTLYVNCIRYFHYQLISKKEFKMASIIYKHISSYDNKLQSAEIGSTLVNIYCYQLFLQNSLISSNKETALSDANEILENLTKLFNEILDTNKQLNFQYPDILKNTMQWLFPRNSIGTVCKFFNMLNADKVKQMFESLFALYGRQTIAVTSREDVQDHAQCILDTLNTLLHFDLIKFQLVVSLLSHCRTECRLQSDKPIAEIFHSLYDYLKLLCAQKQTLDFQRIYSLRCERFKELFDKHSKAVMAQPWFGDFMVFLHHIHSNLQNTKIFGCFWKQMIKADCFTSMFKLLVDCIKLATCITSETKLFNTTCCKSIRKHVILSFAQISIAAFVFYCQNVDPQDGHEEEEINQDNNFTDNYTQTIHKLLIMIINYAFKCIDKMDCISSTSQDINILLTRFKQATLSVKTSRQAGTCVAILELYLKIKTKIPSPEWPLLLRRIYKTVTQHATNTPYHGQEIQMCYIASMLHESIEQIDIGQIRTQINIYYAAGGGVVTQTNELAQLQQIHENCLMHLYHTTTCLFRPHLEPSRKKLLHWLESQHILKYHKSNNPLLHSLLKTSQSQYDFVVITRVAKLHTYALAKISSIYKSLSSKAQELGRLRRLEQLTFAHACLILLNDQFGNQKFQIESKHFNEDHLEELLVRKEMESFTINNELKRFKLALEAFKAFEEFYEQFDNELISLDDAIIDWESIIDDLTFLAQYLQLSGYMEYCSQVWLLHYKCARLIQDDVSALRSLTFFCEYSQYLDKYNNSGFKLENELEANFPTITAALDNLTAVHRSNQSHILLAVLQIAYYYARTLRYSFAQILIEYVEQKHCELPERQGRYDLIMATLDVIKFRLMWRQFEEKMSPHHQEGCTTAQSSLLQQCLLHEMEETLDRFHKYQIISSCDGINYSILIISLAQEFAECTANRLTDCFLSSFLNVSSKLSLQYGLALRFVQVMSMWMWINLQMEYVNKAQIKLKMIEYVMGVKSIKELTENCAKAMIDIQSSTLISTNSKDLISQSHNPGMEAIRKLAQVQLSPIKTGKLQISPSARNFDLKRYFKCNIEAELKPQNELMEWTFFTVGCLNARLYFLVEDYDQLESFYENGSKWLQRQKNTFNKHYYKNIYLMAMQHYVNFLRSQRRYDKALQCLEQALKLCDTVKFHIDVVYYINFQLQLVATRKELEEGSNAVENKVQNHNNPRRALVFNDIPSSNSSDESSCSSTTNSTKPKQKTKFKICEDSQEIPDLDDIMKEIFGSCPEVGQVLKITKRTIELNEENKTPIIPRKITKSTKTPAPSTGTAKKIKRPPPLSIDLSDSPLSSPTSFLNIILSDSSLDQLETKENLKKTPAPSTGTSKQIKRRSPPSTECQPHIHIDLSDSPLSSPSNIQNIIVSKSSLDRVETKENLNFTNDFVEQMKNLDIDEGNKNPTGTAAKPKSIGPSTGTMNKIKQPPPPPSKCEPQVDMVLSDGSQLLNIILTDLEIESIEAIEKPTGIAAKTKSRGRRPISMKLPPSDDIIVITDSPSTPSVSKNVVDIPKATRTRNRDKTPVAKASEAAVSTRPRRLRKLVLENDENPISSSTILPPSRRRQKNIV